MMLHVMVSLVRDIQRVWRGHQARAALLRRAGMVCLVQACVRMFLLRSKFSQMKKAAVVVQAIARGRRCRVAFLLVRELVILAQATVRGWFERRLAAKERAVRVSELRAQVFELWVRASTPLIYRSKFWVLFKGGGFLDLAIHEDEALRLWRDLGLVDQQKEHVARTYFNQTFLYVAAWLRATRQPTSAAQEWVQVQSQQLSAPSPTGGSSLPAVRARLQTCVCDRGAGARCRGVFQFSNPYHAPPPPPYTHNRHMLALPLSKQRSSSRNGLSLGRSRKNLGNGVGLGLTSTALSALGLGAFRRGSAVPPGNNSSVPGVMGGAQGNGVGNGSGVSAEGLRMAAERLEEERESLYNELKRETQEGTRMSLFTMFGLERQKKRKRKLAYVLWTEACVADASAEVVLSVFRDHLESRHAWVENKRDARIRADLLCTVQARACILSLQRIKNESTDSGGSITAGASVGASITNSLFLGGRSNGGGGGGSACGLVRATSVAGSLGAEERASPSRPQSWRSASTWAQESPSDQ
ncbi:unnamed protein product [Discosporangium mesarthrocarpum]